jgi:hypothetical protein
VIAVVRAITSVEKALGLEAKGRRMKMTRSSRQWGWMEVMTKLPAAWAGGAGSWNTVWEREVVAMKEPSVKI